MVFVLQVSKKIESSQSWPQQFLDHNAGCYLVLEKITPSKSGMVDSMTPHSDWMESTISTTEQRSAVRTIAGAYDAPGASWPESDLGGHGWQHRCSGRIR
jgi:hypothetical protein